MLTRRSTLALPALMLPGLLLPGQAHAQGVQGATAFVTSFGETLTAIINGPGSYEEKKRRLAPVIEQDVDVDGIARFCLGRFIRQATPAQQQEYSQLFHRVLLTNIFGKLGEFRGVTFQMTTTTQTEEGSTVGTLIQRPGQKANTVQWVVAASTGRPKIIDVKAEGTSLRLTQRNDYTSYLTRNGDDVGALLTAMRGQLAG